MLATERVHCESHLPSTLIFAISICPRKALSAQAHAVAAKVQTCLEVAASGVRFSALICCAHAEPALFRALYIHSSGQLTFSSVPLYSYLLFLEHYPPTNALFSAF